MPLPQCDQRSSDTQRSCSLPSPLHGDPGLHLALESSQRLEDSPLLCQTWLPPALCSPDFLIPGRGLSQKSLEAPFTPALSGLLSPGRWLSPHCLPSALKLCFSARSQHRAAVCSQSPWASPAQALGTSPILWEASFISCLPSRVCRDAFPGQMSWNCRLKRTPSVLTFSRLWCFLHSVPDTWLSTHVLGT